MSEPLPPDPTVAMGSTGVDAASARAAKPIPTAEAAVDALDPQFAALPAIQLRDAQGESPTPVVRSSAAAPQVERDPTGRLQFQGEIARGGMGAILKGHDRFLGRDIAIKVLLEEHQDKPDFAQRFIEEAQITGQLQHPGIVPVYELGQFRDLRPFFTMKLVKGKTLAALMADRKDPTHERGRFLGIFMQLCQTLAYAHARGVIHRDLKPSNIMVGAFGEVQVMDWGLAKVLREGGVADEKKAQQRADVSVIRTQRSVAADVTTGSSVYTQVGSILGTPSYLAPEQARGDVELVDERADVFGLGAILCELLTGEPPYTGRGPEATRKAQTGNLDEAWSRLDACGADPELINIARHCLAPEPWDRPRDAGAVAKELAAYQNSVEQRLRQAELAHAAESARAEQALHTASEAKAKAKAEGRARRMTLALAASILLAAGLLAAGWRRIELDRIGRAGALNARVNAALQEAMRQRGLAQGAGVGDLAPWAAAITAAKQADALLEPGVERSLRQQVQSLLTEVSAGAAGAEVEAHATERDRQLLDRLVDIRSAKEDDEDGTLTDAAYADAFREAGLDAEALAPADLAAKLASRPRGVVVHLAAYIDDWAQLRRQRRADAEGASRLVEAAQAIDPDPWRQKLRETIARTDQDKLAALQQLAASSQDDELGPISLNLLGQALHAGGDAAAAEKVLRFAQQRHPEDVWVNYDLASALVRLGRRQEAVRYYMAARALRPEVAHALAHSLQDIGEPDEAIRVFQELTRIRPKTGRHLACYGAALRSRGRTEEAEAVYDAAIAALTDQIKITPTASMLQNSLGIAFAGKNQYDEAIAAYRKAYELNPKNFTARNNLCGALRIKARAWQESGQLEEAIAAYREALQLDPRDSVTHESLTAVLQTHGQLNQTIDAYRQAIELDPKAAMARFGLPLALRASGNLEAAIRAYREAIEFEPKLVWLYGRLATALRENGQLDDAIGALRQAIAIDPRAGWLHNNLGLALRSKGQLDDAIAELRKSVELDPRYALGHNNLGLALAAKGLSAEAVAAYRKAIEADPKYVSAHDNLVNALKAEGKLEETIASYRKLQDQDRQNAVARYGLIVALRASGQLDEALTACREAIEADPKLSWLYNTLGLILRSKGQSAEAIAPHRKAVELSPTLAAFYSNLGLSLRDAGQIEESVAAFRKAIELAPTVATYHNSLGWTLPLLGRYDEAIAACRKAIELSPRVVAYHHSLAFALQGKGEAEQAVAAYHDTLALQPDHFYSHRDLGDLLYSLGRYLGAATHLDQAITVLPKITTRSDYGYKPNQVDLYEAACCAALAAAGKDKQSGNLDDSQITHWRKKAIQWLRIELDERTKQLDGGKAGDAAGIIQALAKWEQDRHLSSLRDADAIQALPADQQEPARKLWADVAALLQKQTGPNSLP